MDRRMTRLLEEGIVLFNRGQFFEAHEVWEEAWRRARDGDELLLHGLIQVAAGFHKLQVGQPPGAASLLAKGASKLAESGAPAVLPDLPSFRAAVETWREAAARMAKRGAIEYDAATIPRIAEPRGAILERRLHSHVTIEASAERVWKVLTDFQSYPDWNPFIVKLEGVPRMGERLTVTLRPPGRPAMTFRPTVIVSDPERELRWLGRVMAPGIFDGEHVFTISPLAGGSVRFSQRETFRGVLVHIMTRSMWNTTRHGFEEMNEALKRRVEGR